MKKLVSIIIPTYNSSKFIKETIDSVINQTYKNWELIVVDDCSTDITTEIVELEILKDNRIRLIKSEKNFGGPALPRNIGIQASKGEFIAFLDSDDLWLPNKLEIQLSYFEKNSNILLNGTNAMTFPNGISNELFIFKNKILSHEFLLKAVKGIITSSLLMKREVIQNLGFFDEDKRLIAVEDYDYWLRLLKFKNRSVLILKQSLVKYRLHSANISFSLNKKNNLTIFDKFLIIYEKHKESEIALNKINYIQNNLEKLKSELEIKESFYRKIIDTKTLLLLKNLSLKSKIFIILRAFVWKFLRFIRF